MAIGSISRTGCDEYDVGESYSECSVRTILVPGGGYNLEALRRSGLVYVQSLIG